MRQRRCGVLLIGLTRDLCSLYTCSEISIWGKQNGPVHSLIGTRLLPDGGYCTGSDRNKNTLKARDLLWLLHVLIPDKMYFHFFIRVCNTMTY